MPKDRLSSIPPVCPRCRLSIVPPALGVACLQCHLSSVPPVCPQCRLSVLSADNTLSKRIPPRSCAWAGTAHSASSLGHQALRRWPCLTTRCAWAWACACTHTCPRACSGLLKAPDVGARVGVHTRMCMSSTCARVSMCVGAAALTSVGTCRETDMLGDSVQVLASLLFPLFSCAAAWAPSRAPSHRQRHLRTSVLVR